MEEPTSKTIEAGRDVKIVEVENLSGDIHLHSEESRPDFQEVNVDRYGTEAYVAPIQSHEALEKLMSESLIILGGNVDFDQLSFAKHLAFEFKNRRSRPYQVKERLYASQAYSIFPLIEQQEQEEKEGGRILIFNETSPQEFSFDIERLHQILRKTGNAAILCSRRPEQAWKMTEADHHFWYHLGKGLSYQSSDLTQMMVRKLNSNEYHWGAWIERQNWEEAGANMRAFPLHSIASQFSTPEEINLFLRFLARDFYDEKPTEEELEGLIQRSKKGKSSNRLNQWFNSLDTKQQMITIVAHVFEGIFDDQLFGIIERLRNSVWQRLDQELGILDYQDLEFMFDFVNLEQVGEEQYIISPRYSDQRFKFLEISWKSHKRRIMEVLKMMVQIVTESVSSHVIDLELFGTKTKRRILRNQISEALSDIGRISQRVVDVHLLRLAANNQAGVHLVAAKAMAKWREVNDEHLFKFLERWNRSDDVRKLIRSLGTQIDLKVESVGGRSAQETIDATLTIVLGFAATYDRPNHMPEQLHESLKRLIYSYQLTVRRSLRDFTLPLIIRYHTSQLFESGRGTLNQLLKYRDYHPAIIQGLIDAYTDTPVLVKEILYRWLENCVKNPNHQTGKLNKRDHVLHLIIEIFRLIPYQAEGIQVISVMHAYEEFSKLRKTEHQAKIRQHLIMSMLDLIEQNVHQASLDPETLLNNIGVDEKELIISELGERILSDRAHQEGGDEQIEEEDRQYSLWVTSPRPILPLENLIKKWLVHSSAGVAQIATVVWLKYIFKMNQDDLLRLTKLRRDRAEKLRLEQEKLEKRMHAKPLYMLPSQVDGIPEEKATIDVKLKIKGAALLHRLNGAEKQFLRTILPASAHSHVFSKEAIKALVKELKEHPEGRNRDLDFGKIEKALNTIFIFKK
ncbi:MAG: hypothetical protein AAF587_39210 [Bacteroidota bacterium]